MVAKKLCSSDFSRTVAVVGRAAVAAIYVLFLVGWRAAEGKERGPVRQWSFQSRSAFRSNGILIMEHKQ